MLLLRVASDYNAPNGVIGAMSSAFGDVTGNESGGCEVYRQNPVEH
jgi:hypothetical protein